MTYRIAFVALILSVFFLGVFAGVWLDRKAREAAFHVEQSR